MLLDDAWLCKTKKKQVHIPRRSCSYSWFSLFHFHSELLQTNKPKYIYGPPTQFKGSEHLPCKPNDPRSIPESTSHKCLTYIIPAPLNPIGAWEHKNSSETHKSARMEHTEQQKTVRDPASTILLECHLSLETLLC